MTDWLKFTLVLWGLVALGVLLEFCFGVLPMEQHAPAHNERGSTEGTSHDHR